MADSIGPDDMGAQDAIEVCVVQRFGVPLSKRFVAEWLTGVPAPHRIGRKIADLSIKLKTEVEALAAEEVSGALHAVAEVFDAEAARYLRPLNEQTPVLVRADVEHRAEPYRCCAQLLRALARKSHR